MSDGGGGVAARTASLVFVRFSFGFCEGIVQGFIKVLANVLAVFRGRAV